MNNFVNKLLDTLLDKYERSKTKKRVVLSCEKDPLFAKYLDEYSPLYVKEEVNDALAKLMNDGLISYEMDSYNYARIVRLINAEKAYELVGRTPKAQILDNDLVLFNGLLERYSNQEIIFKYLKREINKIVSGNKYDSFEQAETICLIVDRILSNKEETSLRVFSKKNFGDSKLLERSFSKIETIFDDDIDTVLEQHNIFKNPRVIHVKGNLVFSLNGVIIDLKKLGHEFVFTSEMIENLDIISIDETAIITVENLTSYYCYCASGLVVYTGGFSSSSLIDFLKKVFTVKSIPHCHFGDIDVNGFEILLDLRKRLQRNVEPVFMGVEELRKYKNECQPLTNNDKIRLRGLLEKTGDEFSDTINYMLINDIKLEQESVEVENYVL